MATKAYKKVLSMGCPLPSLEEWRHWETYKATGHTESLKKATQDDYVKVYNHFGAYLDIKKKEDGTYSEMDTAMHLLQDAMRKHEITPAYLASIVRDKLHIQCTPATVMWLLPKSAAVEYIQHLTWTVINRGREEARKMEKVTGLKTYEPHIDESTMPPGGLRGHVGAVIVDEFPSPNPSTSRGCRNTAQFPF